MEYNFKNLQLVRASIRSHLTVDLLPKYMVLRNISGGSNGTYGHCHTASGVLYKIFGSRNLHMYRAKDHEGMYHWWCQDREGGIIDITSEQYTNLGIIPPYEHGKKASMLGFDYRKRVQILYERVLSDVNIITN